MKDSKVHMLILLSHLMINLINIDSQQHHNDDDHNNVQVVWVGEQRLLTSGFSGKLVMSMIMWLGIRNNHNREDCTLVDKLERNEPFLGYFISFSA